MRLSTRWERIGDFKRKPELARTELQLFGPDYRAIPYVGRRADLEFLWEWLADPAPISIQVVAGRGGSGKTRIAYQFLEEIETAPAPHLACPVSWRITNSPTCLTNQRFRRWPGRKPTLIVIDYAASALPHLRDSVIPELKRKVPGEPWRRALRILLLERTAGEREGWYADLRRQAGAARSCVSEPAWCSADSPGRPPPAL